jgi:ATP-dependent exoDNAse (exonuclease V) beta subunit
MITRNLHQLGLIWDITNEISLQNAENNRFMLSDTALFLNRMMDDSDAPFIYEKIGAEIHHVMIDEFQDTSRLQWRNFKVLLSEILAKDDFSLIVGDVKQSIYRWRNGDWHILNTIGETLHCTPSTLDYNFRSERAVIDFNNHFFTHAAESLNQLFETHFGEAEDSPFLSTYNPGNVIQKTHKTIEKGFVSIDFLSDKNKDEDYDELMKKSVLNKLLELSEKEIPANQICMLTRYNRNIVSLAEYLSSLKAEYPQLAEKHYLDLISNEAFQLDSSLAVKIIIEALKCIADPENSVSRAQLQSFLGEGQKAKGETENSSPFALYPSPFALHHLPLLELIAHLYQLLELEKIPGQSAYLFSLYDAITGYLSEKSSDIPNFLAYWNEELHKKPVASGTGIDGVRVMSIHKSKGLQFHTVIIPYCDWEIDPRTGTTVWCEPKSGLYDLELLPVSYNKGMGETVFAPEYKDETTQTWMDNLNVLYVAFTRAEQQLIILAKANEKIKDASEIATVADLLQLNVNQLNGSWNEENRVFEKGVLTSVLGRDDSNKKTDNVLKQTPRPYPVTFVSEAFKPGISIFKQSNRSREFISSQTSAKESYVSYGNLMHKLFEQINDWNDIDRAIENQISEGSIPLEKKQYYAEKIRSAIIESGVEDWFSGNYKNYTESTILLEENGEVKQKRPDRVLFKEDSTLVIDFKFGEAHNAHIKQVKQYMNLMESMNYPQVKGYLWYVEEQKVVAC